MAAGRARDIVGRDLERGALDRLLDDVRRGQSGALVLRGEAGIGKTALLDYATAQASGFRTASVGGVQAEMELPFAAIHQLCNSMLTGLSRLPEPQRVALSVAFGLSMGDPPDRFLVALATLTLLSNTAEEVPLLCVVDDAQWLDTASAQVLGFVARRLHAESVAILAAVRAPAQMPELAGMAELSVTGLGREDARALLATAIVGRIDERVADRLIAETRGNPLALLELPHGLSAAEIAGGFAMPVPDGIPGWIEDQYVRRTRALPKATQRLMLLAAADPVGDPMLLLQAAQALGMDWDAREPAVDAGLLDIDRQVRFRHPLVRSAIYGASTSAERRAVHAALATAIGNADPDRRAWHRAHAVNGPDEAVARELIESAKSAQRRGGIAAAAAFIERATGLTPDATLRAERALSAAGAKFQAGDLPFAEALLDLADESLSDERNRAQAQRLRAQISFDLRRGRDAPRLLLQAAQRLEPLDVDLARDTHLEALVAAVYASCYAAGTDVQDIATAALSVRLDPEPVPASQLMIRGLATRLTEGSVAAAPLLRQALEAYLAQERTLDRLCLAYNIAAEELWDQEAWRELASSQVELARSTGTVLLLPYALDYLAGALTQAGDLTSASMLLEEAEGLGLGVRAEFPLRIAAWRGDEVTSLRLHDEFISGAAARGEGCAIAGAEYDLAVLYNGLARYDLALEAAQKAGEWDDVVTSSWTLYELAEAASRCGRPELAQDAVDRLSERALASGTLWALGCLARSRALVAEGAAAETFYREAIDLLAASPMVWYLARAHLSFGEWLRREGRRRDAREHLHAAHGMFLEMGANGFAERANRELAAAGGLIRAQVQHSIEELTAQELQIAQLASQRLSNPEIGARLFLSPRTVEWHLRKVFVKLSIRSRRELADAMAGSRLTAV
ncbi:ATP-binding protein [Humibacillus xanthopallidus]|uniref:Regulatory LuxR family protein n=1 Tax=Humibacillus xanthopallidus TaxID=412689 RepID=A0A543I290_9MICO|nr:helix-turn-helix transcriptional regulator [Humibacillus xanthopallidus]TQM64713.1 regulatory LuxR family protein [Humibacillus xanthopallidus]